MLLRLWCWARRDWHVSRELIPLYALALLFFGTSYEGLVAANVLYHTAIAPLFALALAFDSAQRRFTRRSFMNDI